MKIELYALWNTETSLDEGYERMTKAEAERRNSIIRENGEPQRWVRSLSEPLYK